MKSRRRDPRAYDYGMYGLRDSQGNWRTLDGLTLTLDQVENWLTHVSQNDLGPVMGGALLGPTGPVTDFFTIKDQLRKAKQFLAEHEQSELT